MKLVTVAEMQAIESESNQQGWTYEQMMEKAGLGLAEVVQSFYGYEEHQTVLGLVGSGNNGGDTLIALAILANEGWQARAYLVRPRPAGDPLRLAPAARPLHQVLVQPLAAHPGRTSTPRHAYSLVRRLRTAPGNP